MVIRAYGAGHKLVLSQDITERDRTDMMRRQFVANVSHEIRTPLTVLSGFIETMSNLTLTDAERRRMLMLMSQQAGRMQTLVQDLLTLAQLEGSPRPDADRWTSLDSVLVQVRAEGGALSAGRHKLGFPDHVGFELAGAEGELLSAFGNLVNNAVRYTPEGGKIDVTWQIHGDGSGELAVCDNGIGIEREHIARLTERFYRVDGSRSRDTGGTGLGLSIVKHVAQRHGAEFDIQSEPGKGSKFRLVFPSARVRPLLAPVLSASAAIGQGHAAKRGSTGRPGKSAAFVERAEFVAVGRPLRYAEKLPARNLLGRSRPAFERQHVAAIGLRRWGRCIDLVAAIELERSKLGPAHAEGRKTRATGHVDQRALHQRAIAARIVEHRKPQGHQQ